MAGCCWSLGYQGHSRCCGVVECWGALVNFGREVSREGDCGCRWNRMVDIVAVVVLWCTVLVDTTPNS